MNPSLFAFLDFGYVDSSYLKKIMCDNILFDSGLSIDKIVWMHVL